MKLIKKSPNTLVLLALISYQTISTTTLQANPATITLLQGWSATTPKPIRLGLGALLVITGITYKTLQGWQNPLDDLHTKALPAPLSTENWHHLSPDQKSNVFFNIIEPLLDHYEQKNIHEQIEIKEGGPEFERKILFDIEEYMEQQDQYFQELEEGLAEADAETRHTIEKLLKNAQEIGSLLTQRMKVMQHRQEIYNQTRSREKWEMMIDEVIGVHRLRSLILYHSHIKAQGAEYEAELLSDLRKFTSELVHNSSADDDAFMDPRSIEAHPNPETRNLLQNELYLVFSEDVLNIQREVQKRQTLYQKTKSSEQWKSLVERHILELKAKEASLSYAS